MAKGKQPRLSAEEMRVAVARVEAHADAAEAWDEAMRETFGSHVDLDAVEWRSHPTGMFRTPVLNAESWECAAEADQARYRGTDAPPPRQAPPPEPLNPEEEHLQLMPNSPL